MEERIKTVVKINNAEYTIVSSAQEEYVRSVAYYVDKKIREESADMRKQLMELADEAGENKLLLDKRTAENTKLNNENQALRISIARLETELKHAKK